MKNIKHLALTLMMMLFVANTANAYTIGVIDFQKVGSSYNYAKLAYKEIDAKSMDLGQYLMDIEKQYKAIDSPIAKKNFEEKTQKEYAQKRAALEKLQITKEDQIYDAVMAATKAVANKRQLDTVIDKKAVFIGGIDITDEVIRLLNSQSGTPAQSSYSRQSAPVTSQSAVRKYQQQKSGN